MRFTAGAGRLLPLVAAFASLPCFVDRLDAQAGPDIARTAAEIAASVSGPACSIDIRGAPRFDGFSSTWLVAYMASGASCDAASSALTRLGKEKSLVFFRRPDSNQVRVLIASIRASVEPAFHCPISVRGEPRFDEDTGYWTVTFVAAEPGCEDAASELSRLGADYQIRFQPTVPRQELVP